jgi:phytoene desaturase
VGAGFGGLAGALRLLARGHRVTLVDRMPRVGGRAQVYERNGFRHDAGPTVVTAPFLLEELFDLFGERLVDHVKLVPVEPWYRFRFPDGRTFDYGGTLEDTLREIRRFDERDADGYQRLLAMSKKIFDVGFTELADQPFHRLWDMVKLAPRMVRLKSYRSVYGLVSSYLRSDALRQAFSIQPLLVGGNPFDTSSIYSLIHFLERRWGVWFAMGGTGAIVEALAALFRRHGGEIRLETSVDRILIERGAARGVVVEGGERIGADLVTVNGDPPFVYKHMIGDEHRGRWSDRRLERLDYSMGLYVLYFGTRRTYPDVAHHTIWMGQRYRSLLADIFKRKILAKDFSLYVHRPTATDPSFAPPGCDSFYVLAPVPNLQGGQNWDALGDTYRDRIVDALDRTLLPGLRDTIVDPFYVTPRTFRTRFLTHHGTGFSIAPTLAQSAYFRFHNKADDIEDLYFVGAGTHPGAGMPGVLCSAKVLDRVVPRVVLGGPA